MTRILMIVNGKYSGNTTAEYGLVGGLVAVVAIAALLLMGQSLSHVFDQAASSKNSTRDFLSTKANPAPSSTNGAKKPQTSISYTTASGIQLKLNAALSGDVGSMVATAGANGATKTMADSLTSVANQLKASGELTDTQYNALINLSNEGHNLARIEAKIENTVATSDGSLELLKNIKGDSSILADSSATYLTIGFMSDPNTPNSLDVADPLSTEKALPATKQFLDAYNAALTSGALNDSDVKSIVDALSSDISYLSHVTAATTGKILTFDVAADSLTQTMASDLTHQDSAGICTVSSATDTSVHCSAIIKMN